MTEPRWFAVHTKASREWLADKNLRQQGFATFYPYFMKTIRHARKTESVRRPYFNRYIFVGIGEFQSHHAVNSTIGVSTIVHAGEQPLEIPSVVMARLHDLASDDGFIAVTQRPRPRFKPGQVGRVNNGPLAGLLFQISRVDDRGQIEIWVHNLGRATRFSLSSARLGELVSPESAVA